jgi:hypothetical protein
MPEMVFEWININVQILLVQYNQKSAKVFYFLTRTVSERMGFKGIRSEI